jgi:hypothetical protein
MKVREKEGRRTSKKENEQEENEKAKTKEKKFLLSSNLQSELIHINEISFLLFFLIRNPS